MLKNVFWGNDKTKEFWASFYKKKTASTEPSSFAEFCLDWLPNDGIVFELGCGNGRDAAYLASKGYEVIACDQCPVALSMIEPSSHLTLLQTDFNQLDKCPELIGLSAIYSRFTLHAIDKKTASKVLSWGYEALKSSGKICIEARSVKDEKYGEGTEVAKDAFVTDHFRRFINIDEMVSELETLGFKIDQSFEGNNVAKYGKENPVVIRIIATKT